MLRFLQRLLLSRSVRLVGVTMLLTGTWLIWRSLPERPLREWRMEGELNVSRARINSTATHAWFETSGLQDSILLECFSAWHVILLPLRPNYRVDLQTGHFSKLTEDERSQELHIPYEFQHEPNEKWPLEMERTNERWTCRDVATNRIVATLAWQPNESTFLSHPKYPANRRWVTFSEKRGGAKSTNFFAKFLQWLNILPPLGNDIYLRIFDPSTGKMVNEVRAWEICRWTADYEKFWTVDTTYSNNGKSNGVACRLWSVRPVGPPWWLWLLTAGGVAGMIWEVRRIIRSSTCMTPSLTRK
jgi:hypothetical protein